MKILSAEIVASAAAAGVPKNGVIRDDIPQFAFTGRSNVGKSSLLNALMRQKLARTSAAAGKTREANFYRVTLDAGAGGPGRSTVFLVDLPGYGYARGGDESAAELAATVHAYFDSGQRSERSAIFLLVDSRHPGLTPDVQAHRWISDSIRPPHVVATKIDKLSRSERTRNLQEMQRRFGTDVLPVSATSGEGIDALWRLITQQAARKSS